MLGFPYDDLDTWRGRHYPEAVFEETFRQISEHFADGLKILDQAGRNAEMEVCQSLDELQAIAEAFYCHFRSAFLQIGFIRRRALRIREELLPILEEEITLAQRLLRIVRRDSRIGFEASNHYYYVENDLMEKILNCEHLKNTLCENERKSGKTRLHGP